jgi:hypothetical protein
MDELSEDARKLIDTAMGKDDAPPPDESWGAFVEHMTSTQARSEEVLVAKAPKPKPRWWPTVLGVVIIAAIVSWRFARDPNAKEVASPPSTAKAPADHRVIEGKPLPVPLPVETPVEPNDAASTAKLLRDAEAALTDGKPDRALALLEDHAERAPLTEPDRRMSLRVLVLCALGREDSARAEARAFLDMHPKSKWVDDVRKSCAGD